MENQLPPPNSQSHQQSIIALLKEQNETLHQLLNFHLNEKKAARRRAIEAFLFHAIPYIALVILVYLVYTSLKGYLDSLNTDINSIKTSVGNITASMKNVVDQISTFPSAISDSIKNLLHF